MTNENTLARLLRDANKIAKSHNCGVKLANGFVIVSGQTIAKSPAMVWSSFDVRIEDIRDPAGKYMMSIKKAGDSEFSRVFATADGRVLFGILRS